MVWPSVLQRRGRGFVELTCFRFLSFHLMQGGSSGLKLNLTPNPRLVGFGRSHQSMQQVLIPLNICVISVRDDVPDEAVTYFSLFFTSLLSLSL